MNIVCYANTWLVLRLEILNFGPEIQLLVWLESTVPGSLTQLRNVAAIFFHLQNLNRLAPLYYRTAVLTESRMKKFLDECWFLVPILTVLVAVILHSIWCFPVNTITIVSIVNGTIQKSTDQDSLYRYTMFNSFFGLVYLILNVYGGVLTYKEVRKIGYRNNANEKFEPAKRARKSLIVSSIAISGNLVFLISTSIALLFNQSSKVDWIRNIVLPITSDMVTFSQPVLLIFLDGPVRRLLKLDRREGVTISRVEKFSESSSNKSIWSRLKKFMNRCRN